MKFAKENGVGPSIAVVDEGGYLLYFVRSEGSFAAGANVSVGKARTSAIFKKPTKDFEDTINKGRFTMTALPDFTPLQGGVPIIQGTAAVTGTEFFRSLVKHLAEGLHVRFAFVAECLPNLAHARWLFFKTTISVRILNMHCPARLA